MRMRARPWSLKAVATLNISSANTGPIGFSDIPRREGRLLKGASYQGL